MTPLTGWGDPDQEVKKSVKSEAFPFSLDEKTTPRQKRIFHSYKKKSSLFLF